MLFIYYCVEPYINYKNTDNDWNHIKPASLDLNQDFIIIYRGECPTLIYPVEGCIMMQNKVLWLVMHHKSRMS